MHDLLWMMVSKSKFLLQQNETVGIVIPMFNEATIAASCVEKVIGAIKNLPLKAQLIVVNDGSLDNTPKILAAKQKKYPTYLTVLHHKKNKGFGGATQTGIKRTLAQKYTWILHMDSDLTNDPRYIKDFISARDNSVDCIKASRYIKGSKVKNVPLYRKVISKSGNYIAYILFGVGIKDCTNGFRMVRSDMLRGLHFHEDNFSIILEELYYLKKKKARFKEIPYTLTVRKNSHSHFSYKPKVFSDYFKYAFLSFFQKGA